MATLFDRIDDDLREWLDDQHVFFVATAPLAGDGHINCSPKGLDSFTVVDEQTVAYLDLTGSGAETIAHVRENGRITLMFCAFSGAPRIVRIQGRGEVHLPGSPRFEDLVTRFAPHLSTRAVITVRADRIADSCGYGVPLLAYRGERRALEAWAEKRGVDGLAGYRADKNARSVDGLPALS